MSIHASSEIVPENLVPSKDPKPQPKFPLQSGDHLTRAEFERRYSAMPNLKNAELIEGVVYVTSPVSTVHGRPHATMMFLLSTYESLTPGVEGYDNTTVRLDLDNEPQPDCILRIHSKNGGQSRESDDNYIEGAPELIAEIAASSVSYDLHSKKNVYRRNGVREYIVWRTLDNAIDWFLLRDGEYVPLTSGEDGIHRSEVFPGLWLDMAALLAGDRLKVLSTLNQGIASSEHAAFVDKLSVAGKGAGGKGGDGDDNGRGSQGGDGGDGGNAISANPVTASEE